MYLFMPVPMGLGATTLDYLICIDGVFIAIETKANGGKLTPRQKLTIATINEAGGHTYVVDDKTDLPQLIKNIEYDVTFRLARNERIRGF